MDSALEQITRKMIEQSEDDDGDYVIPNSAPDNNVSNGIVVQSGPIGTAKNKSAISTPKFGRFNENKKAARPKSELSMSEKANTFGV